MLVLKLIILFVALFLFIEYLKHNTWEESQRSHYVNEYIYWSMICLDLRYNILSADDQDKDLLWLKLKNSEEKSDVYKAKLGKFRRSEKKRIYKELDEHRAGLNRD